MRFNSPNLSLADLFGKDYAESLIKGIVVLGRMNEEEARDLVYKKVDFYSEQDQIRCDEMLEMVGKKVVDVDFPEMEGAPTSSYRQAANLNLSPVAGASCYRLGEDGKVYILGKSEHYHASLGHAFGAYKLIEIAHRLGIPNATHNNTRGYITRTNERTIIAEMNGLDVNDKKLDEIIESKERHVLNRVINLQAGSLADEAGIKMMLSRFYRHEGSSETPKYAGKTPVFFVMADDNGGLEGNYHGTTIFAQTFRSLWPEFTKAMEDAGIFKVVSVKINDAEDFKAKLETYNSGNYKTAGFLHEIVLMNYGGMTLTKEYLDAVYKMCHDTDTPTLVDEIQSGLWYGKTLLFRELDIHPDFVVIGKGFPGGEYAASKVITTADMDNLCQFGALVTNGQEELASLSYLLGMKFIMANREEVAYHGKVFEDGMRAVCAKYPEHIASVNGAGHLLAVQFTDRYMADIVAKAIAKEKCIDITTQMTKAALLPTIMFKPPVSASEKLLKYMVEKFDEVLAEKGK